MNGLDCGKRKFKLRLMLFNVARPPVPTEKWPLRKTDHVKTSSLRQVKARISFFSVLTLLGGLILPINARESADVIFHDGNIYTVNDKQPRAEAIALKNGRIAFIGSNQDALKFKDDKTRLIDLRGHTVVPGLTDAHCHIFGIGERELTLNLEGTNSLPDFLAKIKARVNQIAAGKWVTGRGWIETFWAPAEFPNRRDIDLISRNNPVFLTRADGHAAIANSLALQAAKIDKNTPDPFGGQILKDKN